MSDWVEHKDPTSGKTYYANSKTGATSWEKPADFGGAGASGWTAVKDPTSGKTYYHNTATGATSWEKPAGFVDPADASASQRKDKVLGKRGAIAKKKAAQPQTVGEKLAARAKKFVSLRKVEKAKTQPSAFARKRGGGAAIPMKAAAAAAPAAAEPALPAGWAAAVHPESGKTYYYNASGATSWTIPEA